MEIKQLKSFAAVIEYGSFTKAAEKTYQSQPTISTHIRSLEDELQTRLIVRDTKNIKITPKGHELYECIKHILDLQEDLLSRWSEETKNIIRLGASTIPSAYILPEILTNYEARYPSTCFSVRQGDSRDVIAGLLGGLYDIGMTGMAVEDEPLLCLPFCTDKMVLITPVNDKFKTLHDECDGIADAKLFRKLMNEPIIIREEGSGTQLSVERLISGLDVSVSDLQIKARINDQEAIKNLVSGGLGISILSEMAVSNFVAAGKLLSFSLPKEVSERNLYLIMPRSKSLNASVQQFADFVREQYGA